jgi:hypothetical protein
MLTIEILTRVRWQPEKRWIVARIAGLILVAMVAAVLSYRHLAGLMTYWGEDGLNAYLGPLAVDGLMLVAATALLSISKEQTLPEEWQGTPEEISAKAFDRGVAAERTASDALALFKSDGADASQALVADPEYLAALAKSDTTQRDWADASQALVADPEYLAQLDPQDDDVDGPELMPEPEPEKSKLHVVKSVSDGDAEQAALQAWLDSGRKLSSSQVAEVLGTSKSTAHRRMKTWERRIQR